MLSRNEYAIFLSGCPIYWNSKLQTKISLSITEAEHVVLNQALQNVTPLMNLVNELILVMKFKFVKPIIKCIIFKYNQSTIAVAKAPSVLPRTKHISLKYYHFRQCMQQGHIDIRYASSTE